MSIKLSVIVPAYNAENTLGYCVQSIQRQRLKDIEIIIVNDGSTDNTREICEEIAENDSRVLVINKKNEGLGLTRNVGINNSKGEYIGFVDADDKVDENYFLELYSAAVSERGDWSDISVGGCSEWFVKNNTFSTATDSFAGKTFSGDQIRELYVPTIIRTDETNAVYNGCSVWKCIYRREVIDKYNIRFQSEKKVLSEDVLFNLEFLEKANKLTVCSTVGYYYAQIEGSLSKRYRPHFFSAIKELYKKERETLFYTDENIKNKYASGYIANIITGCIDEASSSQPYKVRIKHIKEVICETDTIKALSKINIRNIRLEKRLFYIALKHHANRILFLLCKMRNLLKG